jgi:hypothetical protein
MKISIIYKIDKKTNTCKYSYWHDGFTKAINILKTKYDIEIINFYDKTNINYNLYDLVLIKEGFDGDIYHNYLNFIKNNKKNCKIGLLISSSNIIPTDDLLKNLDILFYETYWYYNYANLKRHKLAIHAFGVDTEIMKNKNLVKKYDVIFIGTCFPYKRPEKILDLPGLKLVIGQIPDKELENKFKQNKVHVINFVSYENLSNYLNMSKLCYIPCQTHGGGERAVLEARACGINVRIEDDNLKLKELLESPIYDSNYYAQQIQNGIFELFKICNF